MPKQIPKKMREAFTEMFANLAPLTKSDRNKALLSEDQVKLIKETRAKGVTPIQLEELTGISVYKIHKIVNAKPPRPPRAHVTGANMIPLGGASADNPAPAAPPMPETTVPTVENCPNLPPELEGNIIIAAARGHAVMFELLQKKQQKRLRKMVPAGRPLQYYVDKYDQMTQKQNDRILNQQLPPKDFAERYLMTSRIIYEMVNPDKKPKDKYNKNKKKKEKPPVTGFTNTLNMHRVLEERQNQDTCQQPQPQVDVAPEETGQAE